MFWDDLYSKDKLVWGEGPSELAIATTKCLQKQRSSSGVFRVLDIGCGYGRDTFYLSDNLKCQALGIDISEKAVEIASKRALEIGRDNVRFQCCDFAALGKDKYDVIISSHVYQLLKAGERRGFREAVRKLLKAGGMFFLSTLSINDPEHNGKGTPVQGEPNSFVDKVYIHLCTREELVQEFGFLAIKELYEHEYDEHRAKGEDHHHILWILTGEYAG